VREIERETEAGASPCDRANSANNVGWISLLAGEDAKPPLERAVRTEGCNDAYLRSSAHANLARLALREGDLAVAAAHLAEARRAVSEPRGLEKIENLEL